MVEKSLKKEKKVEYIELIYDLVFVYIIGKNNSLLHNFSNGFVEQKAFIAYILCSLAIIQVWNFSTFYINIFGRNKARDYIFLFINMYLLYFIGEGTRTDWQNYNIQYHLAWGLILVNVGLQYAIELKNQKGNALNTSIIKRMCFVLFTEAIIVFSACFTPLNAGIILSAVAIICGVLFTFLSRKGTKESVVDFMHLTERVMLYVVFSFGEMIIALSSYFTGDGSFSANTIYFSLSAFLIVVGLFLSYGLVYDKLINREGSYNGLVYMLVHIFIIFSMNNITASLEFMREEEIRILPKMLFLVASIVMYFLFIFLLRGYFKEEYKHEKVLLINTTLITAAFVVLMLIFRNNMYINIIISVIYVFAVYLALYPICRRKTKNALNE
ncbi:MAG: low temperature requirement protein A [Eubacterium sp.]|nr:low temperature requirement protein A [Eubacterium sp.]